MSASTVLSRFSSRLSPLARRVSNMTIAAPVRLSSQSQVSASVRRVSGISRLPLELSSIGSLMPLHSAIASARLRSMLSTESQIWGLIPQGISMPF